MKSFCQGMGCIYETDWVYNFSSNIIPLQSLLHTVLKEEFMCLQDKRKL